MNIKAIAHHHRLRARRESHLHGVVMMKRNIRVVPEGRRWHGNASLIDG